MILFEHTSFSYQQDHQALNDVSVRIRTGEFVCILGSNGSGKSTLAKMMNGLLIPSTGKVLVDNHDTSDPGNALMVRSTASMVFQNPDNQMVASIVEDEVAFGPENIGIEPNEIRVRVAKSLQAVGLEGYEQRDIATLSGGQRQRVAIAGALAMRPKILILDEASAMLDPQGRQELIRICKYLHNHGMTIVMITHSMEEAMEADRCLVLREGSIAYDGTPEALACNTQLMNSFGLAPSFTTQLSEQLQRYGVQVPTCTRSEQLIHHIKAIAGLE